MALHLEGALSFTVDGPRASTAGTAHADETALRVRAEDPVAAWDAVARCRPLGDRPARRAGGPARRRGPLGRGPGPGGLLTTVGAGADCALGRVVTGSRHVPPGTATAPRPLVLWRVGQAVRRPRTLLPALGAAAVVVVRHGRHGRHGR